ncbi:hypothetical protein GA0115246_104904 [Streptomyces sp. SolWspMP-sol7th]|uniref:hypothetical protein n=1 Tax=Streptomyces sp. SolWspMP-sol7th TaxID=1839776 RepID=UPI00081E51CC|nr:hypothetical protein [Streptomyces sp. SolWspMP-sol7th]SCD70815.1 hypothetical protein GA0115246_104904 [Streptomyces sp. SolWspMP-sol7th]
MSMRPSPLKSPKVQPVGAIVLSMGSGAASRLNGVKRSAAGAVGVYVTTMRLVRVSTMHMPLGRPCPVTSLIAMAAPTDEIQERIFS